MVCLCGCFYVVFVFMFMVLVQDWLYEIDVIIVWLLGFFVGCLVVIDLFLVDFSQVGIGYFFISLYDCQICVFGIEGVEEVKFILMMLLLLFGGWSCVVELIVLKKVEVKLESKLSLLLLENLVCLGQIVIFLDGDVIIFGLVGLGVEVVVGGLIYVYGVL